MATRPQIAGDTTIKIDYNPQVNKVRFPLNCVGPNGVVTLTTCPVTPTDSNSIFVDATTGDDANDGTSAIPVETINHAISLCTVAKIYVIIADNSDYKGELACTNAFFSGLYKATGSTARLSLRLNDYTDTDSNTIYVSKSGNDTTGDGTQANPVLTIEKARTLITGSKVYIYILDSGEYACEAITESGITGGVYSDEFLYPTLTFGATHGDDSVNVYGEVSGSVISSTNGTTFSDLYTMGISAVESSGRIYFFQYGCYYLVSNIRVSPTLIMTVIDSATLVKLNSYVIKTYYPYPATTVNVNPAYHDLYNGIMSLNIYENNICISVSYSGEQVGDGYLTYGRDNLILSKSGTILYSSASSSTLSGSQSYREYFSNMYLNDKDYTCFVWIGTQTGVPYLIKVNAITGVETSVAIGDASTKRGTFTIIENNDGNIEIYCRDADTTPYVIVVNPALMTVVTAQTTTSSYGCYRKSGNYLLADALYSDHATKISGSLTTRVNPITQFVSSDYAVYTMGQTATTVTLQEKTPIFSFLSHGGNNVGITVNSEIEYPVNAILTADDVKHVELNLPYYDTKNNDGAIKSTGSNILNTVCDNNGVTITKNAFNVKNSTIIRAGGDGIYLDGAASASGDITIQNCDIVNCYSGINLLNNNGSNELIKNNIISGNGAYGIQAETQVSQSYSINTDTNINVTNGTNVVLNNPLFVNEGAINPDDTDLHIKKRVLGYRTDSPAFALGDDGYDAGAYKEVVIGSNTTWDNLTVRKPEVIPIKVKYANAVNNVMADGSIDSYAEGFTEHVELKWQGLTNEEFQYIYDLWLNPQSEVRIYFNPVTDPTTYYTYTIMRDDLNASASEVVYDDDAKEDFSIFLARKIEAA